ncbi:diguanylate cyclase [Paenibacillus sp. OV219]|uniref:GGDEF domain-containing protein n=1 Tax=Paenibacillus sp. OV219 TaxID=1884377 RepID=UPI0008BD3551|nr:GGDEF domain-containing protein [Paenibacillus sp. OV219]SEM63378.1 diguanylate cyclase (GGDEF) domain-containing protein [Paenibacillus sp. OV219]
MNERLLSIDTATPHLGEAYMRFIPRTWRFFERGQVMKRIEQWQRIAANGIGLREIADWTETDSQLDVRLTPLPEGFIPFAAFASQDGLSDSDRARVMASLFDTLGLLHVDQFYMGFLSPDLISVNPNTLQVMLCLQPFPSVHPFLDFHIKDYPFELFSAHCRTHTITRASDIYAAGTIMRELFRGHLVYPPLKVLYERLIGDPSFLFIEEAAYEISRIYGLSREPWEQTIGPNAHAWLYHAEPPISPESQRQFRRFLRAEGSKQIALIHEDESLIAEVLRFHMNEVLEKQSFVTIKCTDVPFSTIIEMVNRIIGALTLTYYPQAEPQFRALARRQRQLVQQYYFGQDVSEAFGEWMLRFYKQLTAIIFVDNIFLIFDECSNMDLESFQLFKYTWSRYSEQLPRLFTIFCGKALVQSDMNEELYHIQFLPRNAVAYSGLMRKRLCRVEPQTLQHLANWLTNQAIDPKYTSMMLESFIDQGLLQLTPAGWVAGARDLPQEGTNPITITEQKLDQLSEEETDLLALFCCLPAPIRVWNLFNANKLPLSQLYVNLHRLAQLGLILFFHQNSVIVHNNVKERLALRYDMAQAYTQAVAYMLEFEKYPSLTLLNLVRKSGDKRREYALLMLYFRRNRKALSSEQSRLLLEQMIGLHELLQRPTMQCFYRLILPVYNGFREMKRCEEVCMKLYELRGRDGDRFKWMFYKMLQNELELADHKDELFAYLENPKHRLSDKLDALCPLVANRVYLNLEPHEKEYIKELYIGQIYPNRHLIPEWEFIDSSYYCIAFIFENFPQLNTWGLALLNKVESMLHYSFYPDLILRVYNMYIHQNNARMARSYIEKVITGATQLGHPNMLEVGHANGMEISLILGDMPAFHYHWNQLVDIKRRDVLEGVRDMIRMYACESRQWELLDRMGQIPDTSDYAKTRMELYRVYAAHRRGERMFPQPAIQEEQPAMFVGALRLLQLGLVEEACRHLQRCIGGAERAGRFPMLEGWTFRELLLAMLSIQSVSETITIDEIGEWIARFKQFIETNAYDLFWADYYYISAVWELRQGAVTNGMLLLRKAINAYYLIQQNDRAVEVKREMEAYMEPLGLPVGWELADNAQVIQIMQERRSFLEQSLDYLTTIRLFDRLPDSLNLSMVIDRVTFALFEYYPVAYASILFDLKFHKSQNYYSAFGPIGRNMLTEYRAGESQLQRVSIALFGAKHRSIRMDVFLHQMNDNVAHQLDQLLHIVKPHIANAVLYEEMMIDSLTGLYLRQHFMDRLVQEVEISKQYGLDVSVLMIDLDDFRKVNELGHQVGDEVLRKIADTIRSLLSQHDIPGRYGGEEMLIILPKTDGKHAMQLASDIRKQIELEFGSGFGQPYRVTVSIGVASMELCHAGTAEELIRYADDAEIKAKKTGKNKVVAAWMLA